jgi:fatty-acyl-CoA synthase
MKLERNVFGMLDQSARAGYRDEPAVGFEGETRTFRQLRDRACLVAGGLQAQGVRAGDRVAVMMGNRLEWVEVFFGLAALGAICVPVNVLLTGPEIKHVCDDSNSAYLVVDEIASASMGNLDHRFDLIVTVGDWAVPDHARTVDYEGLLASSPETVTITGPDLDDTFILYYSSGTTGLPKAAEHTHNGIMWNSAGQLLGLGLGRDVRYAVMPSLSWAAGFHNLVLALLSIGGYSEIRRTGGATAESIVSMLIGARITHVMLVPSLLRELLTRPDLLAELDRSNVRWIITGSEPVPRAVIDKCSAAMPSISVCQGYGLSEFPTIATVLAPEEVASHDGSAGRPLPFTSVAVRDSEDVFRTAGRGELLIRSLSSMRGYYNRPDQTDAVFRDGWLHTGDLVDLDDDGFITVVGRTKDLIISGGLNVYPKEIEDILHRLPGVAEVAVVGVPHERFGETAVAVIVTRGTSFREESVHDVCREQLAAYKRPRIVLVRDSPLPRNANAKVLKRELRTWAAEVTAGAVEGRS